MEAGNVRSPRGRGWTPSPVTEGQKSGSLTVEVPYAGRRLHWKAEMQSSLNSPLPSTLLSLTPRGCNAFTFLSLVFLMGWPAVQLQQMDTDQIAPSFSAHKMRKHCLLYLACKWCRAFTLAIIKFQRIKTTGAIIYIVYSCLLLYRFPLRLRVSFNCFCLTFKLYYLFTIYY